MSDEKTIPDEAAQLRRQAEEKAAQETARMPEDLGTLSPEEQRRLLHELRVHQIELEMQNDKLRATQAQLEASRERYFDLYDLAPVGYVTLSEEGLIQEANLTAATMLGMERQSLAGQPLTRFIGSEDQDVYHLHCKQLFETGEPQVSELCMRHADGTRFWARVETAVGSEPGGGPVCRAVVSDITERERATRELKESQRRYQNLAGISPVGIFHTDENGATTYVNPAWCRTSGQSVDEALGAGWLNAVHSDDRERLSKGWQEASRRHQASVSEYRFVRPDGSVAWVIGQAIPERDSENQFTGFVGTITDITDRKHAEAAQREAEARYRLLFERSPDGIVVLDPNTAKPLEFNEAAHRQLGYSREEFAHLSVFDLEDAQTSEETRSTIAKVMREGRSDFETRQRRRDGEVRTIHVIAQFSQILGQPVYHCIWRDVTERRRAEEALRASEERYRLIVMSTSDGIFSLDLAGRITFASPHWLQKGGYAEADVIGRRMTDLVPEEYRDEAWEKFARGLGGAEIPAYEVELLASDGSRVPVEISMSSLTDGKGNVIGRIGVLRDITERKQAEAALAHSRAQLIESQRLEAVGRLAGGIAHDFNNILQAMLSLATVLRLKAGSQELAKVVSEIEAHIKRGAGLTQQLLLFSRRQMAEKRRLDLGELVGASRVLLRGLIPENIRLAVETAPGRLWVDGDAGQLQQVLMNLAINARDAMPGDGTLTVRASEQDGSAVLEVADTGHGMDEETRSHLFEPFFTTKEAWKGTGLGLSVVHGIVEQHGGRIEVTSVPGEGSVFRVILPLVAAPPETAGTLGGGAEVPRGNGERVLVVEDEEGARKGLTELLAMLGYEVTAAGSGEEAGILPAEPAPDLLLTDLMLPGIDGAGLAAGLRGRWPNLKVVLMSGYTEDEAVRRGVDEGSLRFLQKPFDMAKLARMIRAALAGPAPVEGAGP